MAGGPGGLTEVLAAGRRISSPGHGSAHVSAGRDEAGDQPRPSAVLDAVFLAGDEAPGDATVEEVLALVVEEAAQGLHPLDEAAQHDLHDVEPHAPRSDAASRRRSAGLRQTA